jgi:hypothetical protein
MGNNIIEIVYPILEDYIINTEPIKNLALSDSVLCFNNSNEWIVIQLEQFLKTPVIWTKYYSDKKALDISIVVCPRTLRACIFEGKLKPKYYKNDDLFLENEEKSIIPIDINISIDLNSEIEINKRYHISIQTLRNSLVDYYDIKFLHPTKNYKYIINKNYLINRLDELDQDIISSSDIDIHPKTLIHIIQYVNNKGERKNTLIIGSNSSNIENLGYDNKKSGFDKYLLDFNKEIIEKDSFIIPILYYKAIKIYNRAKKIIL